MQAWRFSGGHIITLFHYHGMVALHTALDLYLWTHGVHVQYAARLRPSLPEMANRMDSFLRMLYWQAHSARQLYAGSKTYLVVYYGVLILFLIRCTIRSALQTCWAPGSFAQGLQDAQDPTLRDGCEDPIFQLLIMSLSEAPRFRDIFPHRELDPDNRADEKLVLDYRGASSVISGWPEL